MARDFNGSSDNLLIASAPVTAVPITIAAWVYADGLSTDHCIASLRDNSTADWFTLWVNSSGSAKAETAHSPTVAIATSSAGISTGSWFHVAAVFAAINSRAAYVSGANKGTNTTSVTPTGIGYTQVGAGYAGFFTRYFNGKVAEVGIWNIALTDQDIADLSTKVSPQLVHPEALVFYSPLFGDFDPEPDLVGGRNLTVTGATAADHPPLAYGGPVTYFLPSGGAPAGGLVPPSIRITHPPFPYSLA